MRFPFTATLDFEITPLVCREPECDCRTMELVFHAGPGAGEGASPEKPPATFSVTVDIGTWQEISRRASVEEHHRILDQYLAGLDPACKALLGDVYRGLKRRELLERRLGTHRFSPEQMASGDLISYNEVCQELVPLPGGGIQVSFSTSFADRTLVVDDFYCPQPNCDCAESLLSVSEHRREGGADQLHPLFAARTDFEGNYLLELRPDAELDLDEATQMTDALLRDNPDLLPKIRLRYETIKKIGGRSVPKPAALPPTAPARPTAEKATKTKPGRNAPCPCGSGKKYKKCCGG